MNDIGDVVQAIVIGIVVAKFLISTGRALKAIELCKECLILLPNEARKKEEQFVNVVTTAIYRTMFKAYSILSDDTNAIKYGRELLVIYRECGKIVKEGELTITLANIHERQCKYAEARELYERAIGITEKTGDRKGQAYAYGQFGTMSYRLGEFVKSKEYLGKELAIKTDIGDRAGEATCYGKLGTVFKYLGEYDKAREYHEKALAIRIESGDRAGEVPCYGNLGNLFRSVGEHDKAKEFYEKALAITTALGDRAGEATVYASLGNVFTSVGEYEKANEYHEKALAVKIEIGDRAGEARVYGNLGTVFQSFGAYHKAKEYYKKALAMTVEIGDRAGESTCYGNLGTVFQSLGEYDKAKEYHEKALAIKIEISERGEEATCYIQLGTLCRSLGEYDKANEYFDKALVMKTEIGDKAGEAAVYANFGALCHSVGEYDKALECYQKALAIKIGIGARAGEAACYGNLGGVFQSLGEYDKAKEYSEKALAIRVKIGDRKGEANNNANLGAVFQSLGKYDKAREYLEKALTIRTEVGDRGGEADDYSILGFLFHSLGDHVMAEGYLDKALSISQDIGNAETEFHCYYYLTLSKISQGKIEEVFDYLLLTVNKSEYLRGFLRDNDKFKIALADIHDFPYRKLSEYFCIYGNPNSALYLLELSRARALADLMRTKYSAATQISAIPQSWNGIENIIKKESKCVCLYISYFEQQVFLWILLTSGVIHLRRIKVNENIIGAELVSSLDHFLSKSFRSLGVLSPRDCEDRSLNGIEPKPRFFQEEILADVRLVEDDGDDDDNQDPEPSLPLLYKMIIAPVADLLDEPEIIIFPDRSLYQVPFAALSDEGGKYLSETFRIRTVPSLMTLKLIQNSPADYHSQTGALIVGDPVVGRVRYKGCRTTFNPLPCARKEAEMIGRLLGVQPLLGEHATKQAVLQAIHSVSLIHFAAHGNAERGEIALSPLCTVTGIPHEEDYLLTMSDISQIRFRAKLVVLSCCHSGCGQIRAEGVVGIARAFLGSGARSVLVALWAIEDRATEQFMSRFYERLVCGKSASESLHETMKWMRDNGFAKVSEWAPFMLIGDNVTFDIEK